jgi:quercetin dioxygenase-like cupin family protein
MLGGLYEVKASAEETGGAMTAMEFTIPDGAGPPPHVHDCAEAIYVLEGNATFHIGDEMREAGPGTFLYFPKGTVETFEPAGPVRLLTFYSPGGMDGFFAEAGEPAGSRTMPPPLQEPPDIEALAEIGTRYGLELRAPQQV